MARAYGQRNDGYEEEFELLRTVETGDTKDNADSTSRSIASVKLFTLSYQSTTRLIVYCFIVLTALLLIATCAVFGSSITSNRKAKYHVNGLVPSVGIANGECETLKYVNLIMHLLINCLGTAIIGCSNYLQQICTSPTYKDIQKEMKKYGDVPFGSNSPTALLRRGEKTVILIWTIFVVTSLPVHLFLNGLTGYSIKAFPVSGSVEVGEIEAPPQPWQKLQITDCTDYLTRAENWVTEFTNMTIVVNNATFYQKYQDFVNSWDQGANETQGPPTPNELSACYIIPSTPLCSVTVRWFPLVVTTIAMVIKTLTAFFAIRNSDHFKYRLYNSLGDFIAVATRHREELAVPGECLANSGEYRREGLRALTDGTDGVRIIPRRAEFKRRFWVRYMGVLDWVVWLFWIVSIIGAWIIVNISLRAVRNAFRNEDSGEITNTFDLFGKAGFGKVSLTFIIPYTAGLPIQIAVANSPQLWLSVGYLLWNNQLTRICGEHEWRSYSGRRKPPRVSYGADVKGVRDTRWLQLPYSMSIMLMVVSTTMHWIVSQTLFVVEVENQSGIPIMNDIPAPDELVFATCYSPTAVFAIAVLATLLILGITIYYFIPFQSWMPFMAGSARVVFASCCALPKDLPEDGIMWGDVSDEYGRLAGFGENAKGLQNGEIYPTRRPAANPAKNSYEPSIKARSTKSYPSSIHESFIESPSSVFSGGFDRTPYRDISDSETLRYPQTGSTMYSRPTHQYTGADKDVEPLAYTSSTSRSVRPTTARSSTLQTESSDFIPTSRSHQTRLPREDVGYGAGYGLDSQTTAPQHSTRDRDDDDDDDDREYDSTSFARGKSPYETRADDSDSGLKWKGWGVNPGNANDSDSEDGSVKEVEHGGHDWKGWGVNPLK